MWVHECIWNGESPHQFNMYSYWDPTHFAISWQPGSLAQLVPLWPTMVRYRPHVGQCKTIYIPNSINVTTFCQCVYVYVCMCGILRSTIKDVHRGNGRATNTWTKWGVMPNINLVLKVIFVKAHALNTNFSQKADSKHCDGSKVPFLSHPVAQLALPDQQGCQT